MTFSQDRDLLVFEPRLFCEMAWPGQTIAAGDDGTLDGDQFTSESADFTATGIKPGMVLTVRPATGPAALEIVEVVSGTTLTVSALRADPESETIVPRIAAEDELSWLIASFGPQAEAIAMEMLAHFGLSPADPASRWTADDIVHPEVLRPVSAYGVLSLALAAAANRGDPQDGYWSKAMHYRANFEQFLPRIKLGLTRDGDSQPAVVRHLGAPRLRRD